MSHNQPAAIRRMGEGTSRELEAVGGAGHSQRAALRPGHGRTGYSQSPSNGIGHPHIATNSGGAIFRNMLAAALYIREVR